VKRTHRDYVLLLRVQRDQPHVVMRRDGHGATGKEVFGFHSPSGDLIETTEHKLTTSHGFFRALVTLAGISKRYVKSCSMKRARFRASESVKSSPGL
jgi:hypothetical protein